MGNSLNKSSPKQPTPKTFEQKPSTTTTEKTKKECSGCKCKTTLSPSSTECGRPAATTIMEEPASTPTLVKENDTIPSNFTNSSSAKEPSEPMSTTPMVVETTIENVTVPIFEKEGEMVESPIIPSKDVEDNIVKDKAPSLNLDALTLTLAQEEEAALELITEEETMRKKDEPETIAPFTTLITTEEVVKTLNDEENSECSNAFEMDKENYNMMVEDGTQDSINNNDPIAVQAQTPEEEGIPNNKIEEKESIPIIEFTIANRKLKLNSAEDVMEYVQFIKDNPSLIRVSLSGNTFGVDAAKALAEALPHLKLIEEFDLHDCFTGRMKKEVHVCVEAFANALKTIKTLKRVDFSDNAFGPVGAEAVAIFLCKATSLQELVLNNNGLGPDGGKIIAQALIDCQKLNTQSGIQSSLRRIEIGRNRLEDGSCYLLSEALKAHGLLEEISLPQNGIRPEGITELSPGIACNPNLTKLDLQDNTFTTNGSKAFSDSIQNLKQLQVLDIGDCLLGSDGCEMVIKALITSGATLSSLNLQYNEMNDHGLELLVQSLGKFNCLKVLMLNGNCFNPIGNTALSLKEALQKDQRIDIIDSWSEMEYYSEEEDEEEEQEELGGSREKVLDKEEIEKESLLLSIGEDEDKNKNKEAKEEEDLAQELGRLDLTKKD